MKWGTWAFPKIVEEYNDVVVDTIPFEGISVTSFFVF